MGITALHGAANRGSDDIIRFLVEKGADLTAQDKEHRSALDWAKGVFLATHPAGAQARFDRADHRAAEGAGQGGALDAPPGRSELSWLLLLPASARAARGRVGARWSGTARAVTTPRTGPAAWT